MGTFQMSFDTPMKRPPPLWAGQPQLPGDEAVVLGEAPDKAVQRRPRPKYERRSHLKAARFS
jgi:hypothetical protein